MHLGKTLPKSTSSIRPSSATPFRGWVAVIVSVVVHGLVLMLFLSQRGGPGENPAPTHERRIEVGLVTLPASRPQAAAAPPPASEPPRPSTPPAPKPVPRPNPKPKPQTPTKPAPTRPAQPKARPQPEPRLQAFRDDFAALGHSFSRDSASESESRTSAGSGGLGLMPGSILNINPRIKYPRHAQQRSMEGTVVVLIHIASDGSCSRVDLLKSSGYQELDDEVLGAVQHWRFQPPMRGGMAVEGTYKHTVIFGVDRVFTDDFERHWREVRVMPSR